MPAGLLSLQGLSEDLLGAHQLPDILLLPPDLHALQSLPLTCSGSLGFGSSSCGSLGYGSRSCSSLGHGSSGFRFLKYGGCGFPSLSYRSRFCYPNYLASRACQSSCYRPICGSRFYEFTC
ncbi:Keratin-associated protein 13-4 [Plecturocebus cupreus]